MGWKWGCQPFSCPCSQNVTHYPKEICSTSLSKESIPTIPFGNLNHPLPARSRFLRAAVRSTCFALWLHHAHPFIAATGNNTCFIQTSKAFGHAVVVSKIWYKLQYCPSRPVLPFCPFWLHTFICLNSLELHCWLSSHPHCLKMLGLCFRVYVRRSQGAGTDPAKASMPRACHRGQGLPSDLPKHSLCLHLVVIDSKFFVGKVFGMTLPKTAWPGHAIVS